MKDKLQNIIHRSPTRPNIGSVHTNSTTIIKIGTGLPLVLSLHNKSTGEQLKHLSGKGHHIRISNIESMHLGNKG